MHFSGTNGAEAAAVSKQPAEKVVGDYRAAAVYLRTLSNAFDTSLPDFPFYLFFYFFFLLGRRSRLALLAMRDTSASTRGHHQWTPEYDEGKRECEKERVKAVSCGGGGGGGATAGVFSPCQVTTLVRVLSRERRLVFVEVKT